MSVEPAGEAGIDPLSSFVQWGKVVNCPVRLNSDYLTSAPREGERLWPPSSVHLEQDTCQPCLYSSISTYKGNSLTTESSRA
jgi:hypothetical protein